MSQNLQRLMVNGVREPDLFVDDKTQIIYFVKSIQNKKVKFSTGVKYPNVKGARREANRLLNNKMNAKTRVIQSLIKDELASWILVKEAEGHAYDTMNNIRRAKKQIEDFWGMKFPSEITADNLTEWYAWWKKNNPKIEMENAVKYMRNFCKYLTQKIVRDKPLLPMVPKIQDPNYKKIRRARKKKKERIITGLEFKKISETAECSDHQIVVLFMYTMASRITETLELQFDSEILLERDVPAYRWSEGQNKADLEGWHALHPSLIPGLRKLRYRRRAEGTTRLFPQERDNTAALKEQQIDWAEWRKRADLGWHWTPHTFRHTCLTNLFANPAMPQGMILKLYRVSLAVAIETYIHPTEESRQLFRDAIKVDL